MDAEPGLSEQYRMASPWPLFIALGIPIAEIGILFSLFPLAVGGLLLFGGSVAGMATETRYAQTPWRAMVVVALPLAALGLGFVYTSIDLPDRGFAIVAAAAILVAGGLAGSLFAQDREEPTY
ncbi:cox cluster protein [Halobellus sp. Atlit-31R]|nr:cox cluster protein [Halobellus sp. Atlit-31R]